MQVSTRFPELMDLAIGLLHETCVLSVPMVFIKRDRASGAELSPEQHHRLMRYSGVEDKERPGG